MPDATTQVSALRADDIFLLWDQTNSQALILAGDALFQIFQFPGNPYHVLPSDWETEASRAHSVGGRRSTWTVFVLHGGGFAGTCWASASAEPPIC